MVQTNAQERFELWNKSDIAEIGGRVEQIWFLFKNVS